VINPFPGIVPNGGYWVSARWFGSTARMGFTIDGEEELRRRDTDCGAVTKPDLLAALLALPVGVRIPRDLISNTMLRTIESAPECAVEVDFQGVTRLLAPVAVPRVAVVEERNWSIALDRAARFAPFCERMIAIDSMPSSGDELIFEARLYGIGVLVGSELVLPPAPYEDRRYSPSRWLLAERIFEHRLADQDARSARTPSA